jgi:predicted DNA-binding WGR domain protein
MKTTMIRTVRGRVRYYTLELTPNLFGEWILSRTYGALRARRPTGVIRQIYMSAKEAYAAMEALLEAKGKRGYTEQHTGEIRC